MTDYEIYVFILCAIVFILLVVLSAICLTSIVKLLVRLIRVGGHDAQILKEAEKLNKGWRLGDVICGIISLLICLVFIIFAAFSIYMNFQTESTSDTVPTLRVVESESMSEKLDTNTYLYENDLNDQFDMFDIVLTYKMPDEYELELYDVVVYQYDDDTMIIHRIIAIEEPNEKHPDCRYFTMRGDNVAYSDSTTVTYDQMLGIYRGEHIPYVGSFVMFMQSPAGWLCILLLVGVVILSPVLENYIGNKKLERLYKIRNGSYSSDFDVDGFYDIYGPDMYLVRGSGGSRGKRGSGGNGGSGGNSGKGNGGGSRGKKSKRGAAAPRPLSDDELFERVLNEPANRRDPSS